MKLYFLAAIMLCNASNSFAQKMEASSSFYNEPTGAVRSILVEYRTEMFSKRIMDKYQRSFKEKCAAKNVTAYFAIIGSDEADNLQKTAEFVCKMNTSGYSASTGRVAATVLGGQGSDLRDRKTYLVLGFKNIYSEIPDWKCFCSIKSFGTTEADPAKCLFEQMVTDGIIK